MTNSDAALVDVLTRPSRAVVLVDGGSGAGKTSWSRGLVRRWTRGVQLVSLDALYPGWHGLRAGSAAVPGILAADAPGYRAWDWERSAPGCWIALDPHVDVVVEGCGALTRLNRSLASAGVWLELDVDERRRRALLRDGDLYGPHWQEWAEQEQAHWAADRPAELADIVVEDGRITRCRPDWAQWAEGRARSTPP